MYIRKCVLMVISLERNIGKKKQKIKTQLSKLEKEDLTEEDIQHHYESLAAFVEMKAFDPCAKVPETLIEAFVDKIIL